RSYKCPPLLRCRGGEAEFQPNGKGPEEGSLAVSLESPMEQAWTGRTSVRRCARGRGPRRGPDRLDNDHDHRGSRGPRGRSAPGLLSFPLVSGQLAWWGVPGFGNWITVFANKVHTYMVIAGLRYDTSPRGEWINQGRGPRWRFSTRTGAGFAVRHYPGL